MKLVLLALSLVTLFTAEQSHAYPSSSHVDQIVSTSSGWGRAFRSTRTETSLNCSIDIECEYPMIAIGYNPSGDPCCKSKWLVEEEVITDSAASLEEAFNDRPEYHWAYIGTSARSPNAGRTQSIDARLDACMGHGAVDTIVASDPDTYMQFQNCQSTCNTSSNGYCTASSNDVCNDRCECKYGQSGCNNL